MSFFFGIHCDKDSGGKKSAGNAGSKDGQVWKCEMHGNPIRGFIASYTNFPNLFGITAIELSPFPAILFSSFFVLCFPTMLEYVEENIGRRKKGK